MTRVVIDKENEITKLENMLKTLTDEKDKQSVRFAINVISGFNEVLSERPRGRWIDVVNSEYPSVWHYECSECHGRPLCTPFTKEDFLSRFCPNCGADMGGKEE